MLKLQERKNIHYGLFDWKFSHKWFHLRIMWLENGTWNHILRIRILDLHVFCVYELWLKSLHFDEKNAWHTSHWNEPRWLTGRDDPDTAAHPKYSPDACTDLSILVAVVEIGTEVEATAVEATADEDDSNRTLFLAGWFIAEVCGVFSIGLATVVRELVVVASSVSTVCFSCCFLSSLSTVCDV